MMVLILSFDFWVMWNVGNVTINDYDEKVRKKYIFLILMVKVFVQYLGYEAFQGMNLLRGNVSLILT